MDIFEPKYPDSPFPDGYCRQCGSHKVYKCGWCRPCEELYNKEQQKMPKQYTVYVETSSIKRLKEALLQNPEAKASVRVEGDNIVCGAAVVSLMKRYKIQYKIVDVVQES